MSNANLFAIFETRFPGDRGATLVESPGGERYSYAEMDRTTAKLASYLAGLGLEAGDRVAGQVEKSPQALFLYLACLRGGFIYLPLNTAYPERELEYFISDARPAALVCRPEAEGIVARVASKGGVANLLTLGGDGSGTLIEKAEAEGGTFQTAQRAADDTAAILYTSGTTGRPKGAMLSHGNLSSNAEVLHRTWGFVPGDVLLHALPLFHTHGLFVACNTVLLNGTGMLFCPKFDVETVKRLLPRATVFMGVPTFYVRLLADAEFGPDYCASMRLFISGSAPLQAKTWHEFKSRTGFEIVERYGMTECGMSTSNPLRGKRKPGTVGLPLEGVSLRVVGDSGEPLGPHDVGQIQFTGPNVFKGYWQNPAKTAEEFTADGFFNSGDLGYVDEDGYVCISGRDKDLIITGGYNVYPKEIELCIDELAGVAESAVIGLPHEDFGEQVTAVIVAADGEKPPKEDEIISALKQRLAGYKVPKQVHYVDNLPRNAMGKVQKNVLREQFSGESKETPAAT